MIIFMGVAGAGKSVQGKMLAEKIGSTWVSTGELLRKELSGKRKKEMLEGRLLDDNEIIGVVDKFLSVYNTQEFILDGFPRTIPQANWLLAKRKKGEVRIDAVVNLKASREVVKKRLIQRGRPDDNEEAIKLRFDEYEKHTLPILDCFKSQDIKVYDINAELDVSTVQADILKRIKSRGE